VLKKVFIRRETIETVFAVNNSTFSAKKIFFLTRKKLGEKQRILGLQDFTQGGKS
jgi:hypothetical protein